MDKPRKTAKKLKKKPEGCGTATPQGGSVRHEAPCSIELSRDAKGQPRWAIKVYGERDDMDEVLDEVIGLDSRLQKETRDNG